MSRPVRRLSSFVIRTLTGRRRRDFLRLAHEWQRRLARAPHRVDYFHQVDDPYSHLTAQALAALCDRYRIELSTHLVSPATGPNLPEPALLAALAVRDAAAVAPHYGLAFPLQANLPSRSAKSLAGRILAAIPPEDFGEAATRVGDALWRDDAEKLESEAAQRGTVDEATQGKCVDAGNALRETWGHYSGAMFHHAGEWYWGVDRLCHLERRLRELGAARSDGMCFPRPEIESKPVPHGAEMTLELFASLRSPYTAIGFSRTLALARGTGVRLVIRPVLPMVMRGAPVTLRKGLYIFRDTLREAEAAGVEFGNLCDPIGEPVRRAYALWPWARSCGRGPDLLDAFLNAAFADGVDTSSDAGLRTVVERAGLDWDEARTHLADDAWEEELETNRVAMVQDMGLWGVPSIRLRGPGDAADFSAWGQDRLWLVAREIQRRGHEPTGASFNDGERRSMTASSAR